MVWGKCEWVLMFVSIAATASSGRFVCAGVFVRSIRILRFGMRVVEKIVQFAVLKL